MRVILIGCVESTLVALKAVASSDRHELVGVITKGHSKRNADYVDVQPFCRKKGIDVLLWNSDLKARAAEWIRKKHADIGLCIGWSELLDEDIFSAPQKGFIGFHPARLPANRGRHPLIWAIFLGLTETASSLFYLEKKADTGDILDQVSIPISDFENARSLYNKVLEILPEQLARVLDGIQDKAIVPTRQTEDGSNEWRKRSFEDGIIDWRMSSIAIVRLVRALCRPYPGATVRWRENYYCVWDARVASMKKPPNAEPGKIIHVNLVEKSLDVAAYDGVVRILDHEIPGQIEAGGYLL